MKLHQCSPKLTQIQQDWKGCLYERNNIAKRIQASGSKLPLEAAHPPKGGIAPGMAPIEVLSHVFFFKGV